MVCVYFHHLKEAKRGLYLWSSLMVIKHTLCMYKSFFFMVIKHTLNVCMYVCVCVCVCMCVCRKYISRVKSNIEQTFNERRHSVIVLVLWPKPSCLRIYVVFLVCAVVLPFWRTFLFLVVFTLTNTSVRFHLREPDMTDWKYFGQCKHCNKVNIIKQDAL